MIIFVDERFDPRFALVREWASIVVQDLDEGIRHLSLFVDIYSGDIDASP